MPEMTALGWFHTVIGILSLASGLISFVQFKLIAWSHRPGQIYLICTLITALSALGIYNQGGFGIAVRARQVKLRWRLDMATAPGDRLFVKDLSRA